MCYSNTLLNAFTMISHTDTYLLNGLGRQRSFLAYTFMLMPVSATLIKYYFSAELYLAPFSLYIALCQNDIRYDI